MPGNEALRIRHRNGLSRFEIEHDFVLGAVILNTRRMSFMRERRHEAQKNSYAQRAIDHIDRESATDRMETLAGKGGQIEWHELIERNNEVSEKTI